MADKKELVRAIRPYEHPKTKRLYLPGEIVDDLTKAQVEKGLREHVLAIKKVSDGDG